MNIRRSQEEREKELLSPFATRSSQTVGREKPEVECEIRTCFQRDRDRILHSKAFRRLKDKTQVFLSPRGDHYRTRMTHTLEVAQNARTVARALDLNELLTEAIALGHDLGHTPFGHSGERVLNQIAYDGFEHALQSVRVVECLEKNGKGLNLTWEVRDGMKNHSTKRMPSTLEGKVVRIADKIAYISHDIDDSIRGHVLTEDDIPKEIRNTLGFSVRERMNTMILDMVEHSQGQSDIIMSKEIYDAMFDLRRFLFKHVYNDSETKQEEKKVHHIIEPLYEHFQQHMELLPSYILNQVEDERSESIAICDYIAGMTDHFAVETYKEIFIPKFWI